MRPNIDLDHQWRLALLKADGELSEHDDALPPDLPATCPFSLEELTASEFAIDRAVERVGPGA
jgi:hypothetical protein